MSMQFHLKSSAYPCSHTPQTAVVPTPAHTPQAAVVSTPAHTLLRLPWCLPLLTHSLGCRGAYPCSHTPQVALVPTPAHTP